MTRATFLPLEGRRRFSNEASSRSSGRGQNSPAFSARSIDRRVLRVLRGVAGFIGISGRFASEYPLDCYLLVIGIDIAVIEINLLFDKAFAFALPYQQKTEDMQLSCYVL
jgi:hypothetical protein